MCPNSHLIDFGAGRSKNGLEPEAHSHDAAIDPENKSLTTNHTNDEEETKGCDIREYSLNSESGLMSPIRGAVYAKCAGGYFTTEERSGSENTESLTGNSHESKAGDFLCSTLDVRSSFFRALQSSISNPQSPVPAGRRGWDLNPR